MRDDIDVCSKLDFELDVCLAFSADNFSFYNLGGPLSVLGPEDSGLRSERFFFT